MAKLFQGQKIYEVAVTDSATRQEVVVPTRHYKAIVATGGNDVFIKWGGSDVVASAAKTGNAYDDEGIDLLTASAIQTLQKPNSATHFSVVCRSGESATVQIIVGEGE